MPNLPTATTQMFFQRIIEIVTKAETKDLQILESLNQTMQKQLIETFQNRVCGNLEKILPKINRRSPYQLTQQRRDEVDIYGAFNSEDDNDGAVIIELDKWRADQISKKFLSRFALTLEKPLIYVALCYGGTPHMHKNECEKYFSYCNRICNSFTQYNLRASKRFYGHMLR
jgi:hypothetical protein